MLKKIRWYSPTTARSAFTSSSWCTAGRSRDFTFCSQALVPMWRDLSNGFLSVCGRLVLNSFFLRRSSHSRSWQETILSTTSKLFSLLFHPFTLFLLPSKQTAWFPALHWQREPGKISRARSPVLFCVSKVQPYIWTWFSWEICFWF